MTRRDGLIGHVDRYLQALVAHEPASLPLAPGVRYTENGQELALGSGLWGTASDVPAHDYAWVANGEARRLGGSASSTSMAARQSSSCAFGCATTRCEAESIVRTPPWLYAREHGRARAIVFESWRRPARRRQQ